MINIDENDKNRICQFIHYNDLDYTIIDDEILKFRIISNDNISFSFYKYDESYIVVKYDKSKDVVNDPTSQAYQYFNFKTISQLLEQLKYYDENLPKKYWEVTTNSAEIGFDKSSYKEDWFEEFSKDVEYTTIEDDDSGYKYLTYNNPKKSPKMKSPYNTLHQVSDINYEEDSYIKVSKLYFEIHPISCQEGNEKYLLKLLSNNEEVLKEFINYIVTKKKGLNNLISEILKNSQ